MAAAKDTRLADLQTVKEAEIRIIRKRRDRLYPDKESSLNASANLVGLALSGGGIRSAVTNLGVLYEMSRVGLLRITDYLSTVSGGGYIGCCLSSLLSVKDPQTGAETGEETFTYRNGAQEPSLFSTTWHSFPLRDCPVADKTAEGCPGEDSGVSDGDQSYCRRFTSRDQVFHLRDRASYLIPSSLPFGSHVLRAMGAVSASTLLSLLWFFSLIVTLTSLYMFMVFPAQPPTPGPAQDVAQAAATLPATGDVPAAAGEPMASKAQVSGDTATGPVVEKDGGAKGIMKRAADALTKIQSGLSRQGAHFATLGNSRWLLLALGLAWGCLAPFLMHLRGRKIRDDDRTGEDFESYVGRKQLKCISWTTVGLLLFILFACFRLTDGPFSYPDARLLLPTVFSLGSLAGSLIILCLLAGDCLPACCAETRKDSNPDSRRDSRSALSWNRLARAEISLCSGIFVYCLAGSYLIAILPAFILAGNSSFITLVQAGLILILRFVLTDNKKKATRQSMEPGAFMTKLRRWLLGLLVPVFILLAVVGVACLLRDLLFGAGWPAVVEPTEMSRAAIVFLLAISLSVLLSLLNFNNISPHIFYKDRLAEAFLATFIRCTHRSKRTGQEQNRMELARNSVEMSLADLHGNDHQEGRPSECAARGPYLLINATMNLTAARDLQGFRRQSENFLLSRCYSGSERTGYLATAEYNPPIEIGRAMTISGAAVTSVRGAMGSLAESFACTILGVRLGYWLRNPIHMALTGKDRKWNWKNLYYELFRYTDTRDSHVYLSDGGHCGDNLGILALLQRRVKLIIASDAECDPEHVFDSLNNSIRRAYVDSRIKIHISLNDLLPDEKRETPQHFALGRILYPDRPWQKSWLLVIKNTITGRESSPILNYRKKSPIFPHETTADQFFSEEQFEVYRSLGREACMEIWRHNIDIFRSADWLNNPWSCIDKFCEKLASEDRQPDDVIKAMWQTEEGDFNSWPGFQKTIRRFAEEMFSVGQNDDSTMVKQLKDLNRWLAANESHFPWLRNKYDIPRNWDQFKIIRDKVAQLPGPART